MKKIWSYLAVGFAFFAAGIVFMYKLMGDQIEINIKKIKTKRGSSDIDIPISLDTPANRRKRTKEQRKADRNERRSK